MARTLVIVAHPDLEGSRVNCAWTEALLGDGRFDVHLLADHRLPTGFDVVAEQALLASHDRIILQYPIHWYAAPGILHDWLDQVLEHGWAYSGGKALLGKELGVAVSTWSTDEDYSTNGRYGHTLAELTSAFEVTAFRIGMTYLGGHFLTGVGHVTDPELDADSAAFIAWLVAPAS